MSATFTIAEFNRRTATYRGQLDALPQWHRFQEAVKTVTALVPWLHIDLEWEIKVVDNGLCLHGLLTPIRHFRLVFCPKFDRFLLTLRQGDEGAAKPGKPMAEETTSTAETDLLGGLSFIVGEHRRTSEEGPGNLFIPFVFERDSTFRCFLLESDVTVRRGTYAWASPSEKTLFFPTPAFASQAVEHPGRSAELFPPDLWLHPADGYVHSAKAVGDVTPVISPIDGMKYGLKKAPFFKAGP